MRPLCIAMLSGQSPDFLVRPQSLTEQIVAAIRESILKGELRPGERLVEQTLARQYGVGQNAVREALIALAHQGFVRRIANRATYVTKFTLDEAQKLGEVRAALEGLAVEKASRRYKNSEITLDKLEEHIGNMAKAAKKRDRDRFYEHDLKFHRELWKLSGNEYLEQTLEQVVLPLFASFIMLYMRKGHALHTLGESLPVHQAVIDGIRGGVPQAARKKLAALVDLAVKHQQGLIDVSS